VAEHHGGKHVVEETVQLMAVRNKKGEKGKGCDPRFSFIPPMAFLQVGQKS
jgi:hypothetical protein